MLLTFGQEIFLPSTLWALTGGPSQPEVNSFEPVGTNQMVDLSTGDFNYNIPLMVVPGPNGGYPINLAYHAGIGMEQEASWVGLGWNINPGAITRNLRGIPDDFNGDEIVKTTNLKPDVTVGMSVTAQQLLGSEEEKAGYNFAKSLTAQSSLKVYFNNYRGVGYRFSITPVSYSKFVACGEKTGSEKKLTAGLNLSFDSNTGLGLSSTIGLGQEAIYKDKNWNKQSSSVGVGFTTRQGLQGVRFSKYKDRGKSENLKLSGSSPISFANYTYVPSTNTTMQGTNQSYGFNVSRKTDLKKFDRLPSIHTDVTINELVNKTRIIKSFGTINLQNTGPVDDNTPYNQAMDFNVYNDLPINRRSVTMGLPVMTTDIYSISGQGIGGTFRAHRNDIGTLYNEGNTSNTASFYESSELATGTKEPTAPETIVILAHVGADAGGGYHKSYSGKWTGGTKQILDLDFKDKRTANPLYEPFYFKVVGEQTAIETYEWNNMGYESPMAFDLGMKPEWTSLKVTAKKNSSIQNRAETADRVKRLQNVQYRTKREIRLDEFAADLPEHIYGEGDYPGVAAGLPINYAGIDGRVEVTSADHHIQEYSILRPDGSLYTYGLPAYITHQEENVFSNVDLVTASAYAEDDLVSYSIPDAGVENDQGIDHYFSSTELPSYVHSHMITKITSADYVDLTGNGPSEDDFGFYAKFNYQVVNDYGWRDPFIDADYIKGFYSNPMDDKASFTYGTKDLFYVHSIETKTHVAIFELGDREDGRGVDDAVGRNQNSGNALGKSQKYLKTIKLYSKNDPDYGSEDAIPLQTIHFEYSYELCPGVLNNTGSNYDHDNDPITASVTNEGGKLTLKKVYITYNGNEKGRLSPYEFEYDINPSYSRLNIDRWGNYQAAEAGSDIHENTVNPYTRQNTTDEEKYTSAAAWSLTTINLPSGGQINVGYEMDDYGYVQDARAAQMVEIYGFSETTRNEPIFAADALNLRKKNLRVWFRADEIIDMATSERDAHILEYVKDLDEVYFKVFTKLKRRHDFSAEFARDYVVGYAKIVSGSYGSFVGGSGEFYGGYGYFDLSETQYKTLGLNSFKVHPFRKAAWQYLRYNRHDLFNNQDDYDRFNGGEAALSIPLALTSALSDVIQLTTLGEYNKYGIMGYCENIEPEKRSFVRLNNPNKRKYGGGHRVKTIELKDNWTEGERKFGTSYEYKNEDGSTSGVADYEPLIGGEENALKGPQWFNGNDKWINIQHQDLYWETPFSEAVYPGARVVYGRVVVKNQTPEDLDSEGFDPNIDVGYSQSGISVNEFYTAKDFPVEERSTGLNHHGYSIPLYIPFMGLSTVQNNGYSQGHVVILNDMSGRPKSMATYPYRNGEVDGLPISEVKYRYKTNAQGKLDNNVRVLDGHGIIRNAIMGVEQDFAVFEEENNSYTESIGTEINTDAKTGFTPAAPSGVTISSFLPLPSFIEFASYEEAMYRGISTSKVIHKTGILDEVEVFSDGSTVVTKNLLYDAETGEALLTTVNNEWDKPVYNYNYAAHWNYEGMGGAYKNYRAKLNIDGGAGSLYLQTSSGGTIIENTGILTLGDEITIETDGVFKTYYVTNISDEYFFRLEDGNGVSLGIEDPVDGIITRSGHRNLQAVKSGTIVALSDAFLNTSRLASIFKSWNKYITGEDSHLGEDLTERFYVNENTGLTESWPVTWSGTEYFLPNIYQCSTGGYNNGKVTSTEANYLADEIHFELSTSFPCTGKLVFDGHDDATETPREKDYIVGVDLGGGTMSYTEQFVDFSIVSEERDLGGDLIGVTLKHLPTGDIFHASWVSTGVGSQCWEACGSVADILHADAVTFSDDWGDTYPYADLGDPKNADEVLISHPDLNEYRYGKKGIWRAKKTYLYQIPRKQSGVEIAKTRINVDGEYQPWEPYSWVPGSLNPKWDWVSEITRYSPYGFGLEEKSRLSYDPASLGDDDEETVILSSQMYGYSNSVVIATSALSSYFEMGFTGFEQFDESADENNTGHINLTTSGAFDVSKEKSHTGTNSVKLLNTSTLHFNSVLLDPEVEDPQVLQGIEGKDYVISLWVNVEATGSPSGKIEVFNESDVALLNEFGDPVAAETGDAREVIDGWKKLEVKFTMPASGIKVKYTSTGVTYVDDLRIGPYDGGMVTYVYDRKNLWLVAELDGLNYATFYNYDEEGNLVQVKKETEKGVVTVKTARSNTLRRIGS